MILRSDLTIKPRDSTSGFTLLEVLISLAAATAVLVVILSIIPAQGIRTKQRFDTLIATEFAFSVLEEYRVTYPQMSSNGTVSDWSWTIEETPDRQLGAETLEGLLSYVEVEVTVWNEKSPENLTKLSTLIARRSQ